MNLAEDVGRSICGGATALTAEPCLASDGETSHQKQEKTSSPKSERDENGGGRTSPKKPGGLKTIIIPDIHEETDLLGKALSLEADRYVFLGDWFDSFKTPKDPTRAENMALVIKQLIKDPKNILILGNHDAHYRWRGRFLCSGYVYEKAKAIEAVLTPEDWNHFKLYHYQDGWLFSHAGFHPTFFTVPGRGEKGFNTKYVDELYDQALINASIGRVHPILSAGYIRGGSQAVGGPIWCHFPDEFKPTAGLNQMFGHTHGKIPRGMESTKSQNWCIDTWRHIGVLENGEMKIEELLYTEEINQ
jgi:hypothetical protein